MLEPAASTPQGKTMNSTILDDLPMANSAPYLASGYGFHRDVQQGAFGRIATYYVTSALIPAITLTQLMSEYQPFNHRMNEVQITISTPPLSGRALIGFQNAYRNALALMELWNRDTGMTAAQIPTTEEWALWPPETTQP